MMIKAMNDERTFDAYFDKRKQFPFHIDWQVNQE